MILGHRKKRKNQAFLVNHNFLSASFHQRRGDKRSQMSFQNRFALPSYPVPLEGYPPTPPPSPLAQLTCSTPSYCLAQGSYPNS